MNADQKAARDCLKGVKQKLDVPYYSRGMFVSEDVAATIWGFPQTSLVLFTYGLGQSMSAAISDPGSALTSAETTATEADTNLIAGSETVDGVDYMICGVGFFVNPKSDGEVIRQLYSEISIELCFGRKTELLIGPPSNAPGGGGMTGAHRNDAVAAASTSHFATNGFADFANVFRLPHKLRWQKPGKRASNFNVKVSLTRDVDVTGFASSPTNARLDFLVKLYGYEVSGLGPN